MANNIERLSYLSLGDTKHSAIVSLQHFPMWL